MEEGKKNKPSEKKTTPVINYICILFTAAFLLLLMTYLMEQRQSAEALDGLRNSVSAMQTVDDLYTQINELKEEISYLEQHSLQLSQQVKELQEKEEILNQELEKYSKKEIAMDRFWQIKFNDTC